MSGLMRRTTADEGHGENSEPMEVALNFASNSEEWDLTYSLSEAHRTALRETVAQFLESVAPRQHSLVVLLRDPTTSFGLVPEGLGVRVTDGMRWKFGAELDRVVESLRIDFPSRAGAIERRLDAILDRPAA